MIPKAGGIFIGVLRREKERSFRRDAETTHAGRVRYP